VNRLAITFISFVLTCIEKKTMAKKKAADDANATGSRTSYAAYSTPTQPVASTIAQTRVPRHDISFIPCIVAHDSCVLDSRSQRPRLAR